MSQSWGTGRWSSNPYSFVRPVPQCFAVAIAACEAVSKELLSESAHLMGPQATETMANAAGASMCASRLRQMATERRTHD